MSQDNNTVDTVLARMKSIYGVRKDAELARALDISPQTLSSWRQRSAIPYALCVECAKAQGASLDWLLYGEGPMMRAAERSAVESTNQDTHSEGLEDIKTKILKTLEGLTQEDLEDILNEAAHRRRLRALEQRFENLQAQFIEETRKLG